MEQGFQFPVDQQNNGVLDMQWSYICEQYRSCLDCMAKVNKTMFYIMYNVDQQNSCRRSQYFSSSIGIVPLNCLDMHGMANRKGQIIHVAARQSPYPGTSIARFPVFDKYVPWEVRNSILFMFNFYIKFLKQLRFKSSFLARLNRF